MQRNQRAVYRVEQRGAPECVRRLHTASTAQYRSCACTCLSVTSTHVTARVYPPPISNAMGDWCAGVRPCTPSVDFVECRYGFRVFHTCASYSSLLASSGGCAEVASRPPATHQQSCAVLQARPHPYTPNRSIAMNTHPRRSSAWPCMLTSGAAALTAAIKANALVCTSLKCAPRSSERETRRARPGCRLHVSR